MLCIYSFMYWKSGTSDLLVLSYLFYNDPNINTFSCYYSYSLLACLEGRKKKCWIAESMVVMLPISGLILGLRPANEIRRYFVTTSLIGWVQNLWPALNFVTNGGTCGCDNDNSCCRRWRESWHLGFRRPITAIFIQVKLFDDMAKTNAFVNPFWSTPATSMSTHSVNKGTECQ